MDGLNLAGGVEAQRILSPGRLEVDKMLFPLLCDLPSRGASLQNTCELAHADANDLLDVLHTLSH